MLQVVTTNNDQGRQNLRQKLKDVIMTLKTGCSLGIHGSYMKKYEKDQHTRDDLLFKDNKIVIPAAARGAFSSMLHESHPDQFGMKFLAEHIWWPHYYREIFYHGKSCKQCSKAGKNLRVLLGSDQVNKIPELSFANEEINLDFAGPLDASETT